MEIKLSTDTFDQNCPCYKDDRNRLWFSAMLLASSARFFQKMYRIVNFSELQSAIKNSDPKFFTEKHDILNEFTKKSLIDDVNLVICFENYMKSVLLKESYLIHLIKPAKIHPKYLDLQVLANKQRTKPVSLAEFLTLDAIVYDMQKKMNVFPSLSDQTLGIGKLLKEADYRAVIKLPKSILKIAERATAQRNNLHYLLGEAAAYFPHLIGDLKKSVHFVNQNIIDPFNAWCVSEQMPKKQMSHRQLQISKRKGRKLTRGVFKFLNTLGLKSVPEFGTKIYQDIKGYVSRRSK